MCGPTAKLAGTAVANLEVALPKAAPESGAILVWS
jgi:hypothetical protein